MALILKHLFRGYSWLFTELPDPRAEGLFLMSSPLYLFLVEGIYLYTVLVVGPKFMKNRPPFKLDKILIVFNLLQVVLNVYILYYGFLELTNLSWFCSPVVYDTSPRGIFLHRLIYLYFWIKILDFLDTIFFLLRKKESQITFLHVYHHFGMVVVGWAGVKFLGGGHSVYMGVINAFVHAVMYFYYFLTIWRPNNKRLWWKKHITQLQLTQFFIFIITYGQLLLKPECGYPKLASYFFVPQNFVMLMLFGEFYVKTYIKPKERKRL